MRTEKPWGYEELVYEDHQFACKYLGITKGQRTSLQYHERKSEAITVLSGLLKVEIGPTMVPTFHAPGSCFVTAPGVVHRMEALEDALLWECSSPQLEDVVRLADDYGRVENDNGS